MLETIVVIVIVGTVLLFAARSFYRTLTGKNDGCGCGTKACPSSTRCKSPDGRHKGAGESHE
ncbi:MAG: FeoB-associated Cys-rich membrane protein [Planctomycetes bacterium]|nr:FeoB-associated Cys-rich membrane protein [Planctomycetota bacterium]